MSPINLCPASPLGSDFGTLASALRFRTCASEFGTPNTVARIHGRFTTLIENACDSNPLCWLDSRGNGMRTGADGNLWITFRSVRQNVESSTAGFRTLVPRFSDSGTPDYLVIHRTLEPPPNNRIKYIF